MEKLYQFYWPRHGLFPLSVRVVALCRAKCKDPLGCQLNRKEPGFYSLEGLGLDRGRGDYTVERVRGGSDKGATER